MKRLISCLILAIVLICGSLSTYAETMNVVNCTQSVSLRTYPNVNSNAIMQIPLGAQVESIGWQNGFNQVSYSGNVGWVLSDYLALNPCIGSFYQSIEPYGRYWFGHTLSISSISDGVVRFNFDYQKPGHAVAFHGNTATFVTPNTAIGYGTWNYGDEAYGSGGKVTYVLIFTGNYIETKIFLGNGNEPAYDISFNIYDDRI